MTPHFKTVPDHWKAPEGPYRQAPPEHGGEWWLVNPFGSTEPWLTQSKPPKVETLPPGFEKIFGPRPQAKDFRGKGYPRNFQAAVGEWEQDLKHFKGVGLPPGFTPDQLGVANRIYESWGMGIAYTFEARYGWSARFPDSQLPDFDCSARAAIESTHLIVAQYQLALLERGIVPERKHPFVPPHVWPGAEEPQSE